VTSGAVRSALALALLAAAGGCLYGFHGGGLPADVRTVAVLPFDNRTGEPALTQEVFSALVDAVSGRLGLRQVNEAQADAIVRGEITSYVPDSPLSYQANQATPGSVDVTRRRVVITMNVEIFDQKQGKALWKQSGLTVDGEYATAETDGRKTALAKLVTQVVEGAQSQW
jgi:hypothetical protein